MKLNTATPWWALAWPALACVILILWFLVGAPGPLVAAAAFVLIATVFGAVYHAEVVAHRVGEPFGTPILALAVTIIEVALIVSMMVTGGANTAELARDTVFAAVMIVCNGIVGFCLLFGGMRHHTQGFHLHGANAALSVLIALTTLSLVLPNVTASTAGRTFSPAQLIFAGLVSLVLYGSFVFVQTIRHRDFFLPPDGASEETHAAPPTNQTALVSAGLLLVSLVAVVGLGTAIIRPNIRLKLIRTRPPSRGECLNSTRPEIIRSPNCDSKSNPSLLSIWRKVISTDC
jgi:Ca2+:H+ antiporter